MRVWLAAVVFVAALIAASSSRAQQPDGSAGSCARGTRPAVIAGSFRCLTAGQRCKVRYQAAYKRYGFRCVAGRLKKGTGSGTGGGGTDLPPPVVPPPPAFQPGHYK